MPKYTRDETERRSGFRKYSIASASVSSWSRIRYGRLRHSGLRVLPIRSELPTTQPLFFWVFGIILAVVMYRIDVFLYTLAA